jgi:aminopeptidase N
MRITSPEHFTCRHHHHHHHHHQALRQNEPTGPRIGAAGVGDPYFPTMGNGGYDAVHYDLDLKVDPLQNHLQATTTMQAKALQDLDTFNLDFRNFDIAHITVNGAPAEFERHDGELTITPQQPLRAGQDFSVQVGYAGNPKPYESEHAPITLGWNSTRDGSYVLSEPDGSSTWYPVNDHPRDKATYKFYVTVPTGYQAVCNGKLVDQQQQGDQTTYVWDARDPMASYLSTVNVGKFVEQTDVGPNGVPIHNFFPPKIARLAEFDFGRVPEMMEWFGERYGDYPFEVYGNLVLNASVGGAALETQTRPVYERGMVTGTRALEFIYAHELGHQWWGNNTSVENWKDIWLSEGFANYTHMMWRHEHDFGIGSLDKAMYRMYRNLPEEGAPVADPGETHLFSENVYNRGAVTLHLLRKELGDESFFSMLRAYSEKFRGQNVTTDDFVQTVNEVSGKDMTAFFEDWVKQPQLPPYPEALKVPDDLA